MRISAVVVVLLASLSAYADQSGTEPIPDSVRFAKLVAAGDQARRSRRNSEAFKAYNDALDIRRDPAVEGRMGLLFFEAGNSASAAEYLLRAITKGQASPYLMKQFHDAFARVRPKVCFVEVYVSEQEAEVLIDGKPEPKSDHNAWHVFIVAGTHTFLAKREGFEEATETLDIPAGGELEVRLNLKPLPPPPPVEVPSPPNPEPKPTSVKPPRRLSDSYLHFYLGTGPVLVLGATPGVALGAQTIFGLRRRFFSLNLDARIAWATDSLEVAPDVQLVNWAIGLRPCGHFAIFFGCGLVQVDGLDSLSEDFFAQTRLGGGVRGGIEVVLRKPVSLQFWGEGTVHSEGYSFARNGQGFWQGSPVVGGFGATVILTK